mmetsp:Transcript_8518/g.19901  ORF Transcript_8518/g.19901 Transcript_8518/m.19901 type:complete len:471 (-) Transcript_8518:110-1522(-)
MSKPKEQGRVLNASSASHSQVVYAAIDQNDEARGINGPMFTRQVCGGGNMNGALLNPDDFYGRNPLDNRHSCPSWQLLTGGEQVAHPWPGNPLGLNVRVPTPVRKGDAYKTGTHYRSRFDPSFPVTSSTLCLQNTGAPGILNIQGLGGTMGSTMPSGHSPTKRYGFMGRVDAPKPQPSAFLRTREKHPELPDPHRFSYPDAHLFCRPRAPKASEAFAAAAAYKYDAPDFIVRNQVDCIVQADSLRRGFKKRMVPNLTGTFDDPSLNATHARLDPRKHLPRPDEAMALEDARKADIAAVLRGENLHSSQRKKRIHTIKTLSHTLKRDEEPVTSPVKKKLRDLAPRPRTTHSSVASSEYEDGSDVVSVASSAYLNEGKLVKRLPVEVRRQLIRGMKARWDAANHDYQRLTLSLFNLDTVNKVTKKEACEALMARLEKDIARISKGQVFCEVPGQDGLARPMGTQSRPFTSAQ